MIRFACPACGKVYKAENELAGRQTACKTCGAIVVIPEPTIREVLYGTELPPEDMVDPAPEPDSDDPPQKSERRKSRSRAKSRRTRDDEFGESDDDDWTPSRQDSGKPGKITAIGAMLLGGGAWAVLNAITGAVILLPYCCFWPGLWFALVWAIFAIVRGAELLRVRVVGAAPHTLLILQIMQLVNLDVVNVVMGIIGLVFLNERKIQSAFRNSRGWD